MSDIGGIGTILIVVSALLLVCVVVLVVVLLTGKKRRNSGNKTENPYETYSNPVNHQDNYQDFTVLKRHQEQKKNTNNFFPEEEESSKTFSIGAGNVFGSGGMNSFYGDSSEKEDKTEVMLGGGSYSPKASFHGHSGGITVQYHRNGVLQNYQMAEPFAIIGREQGCDILIDSDNYMSEQHAILFVKNRAVYLADLSSKNGTFVNDERIKGVVRLSGKDKARVASSNIKVITN